jgi:hypothetical protein
LSKLDQGGSLVVGNLNLDKTSAKVSMPGFGSFDSKGETVSGSFGRYTVDNVGHANFPLVQIRACFVLRSVDTSEVVTQSRPPVPLDAGAQLLLNGPNATNKAVPRQPNTTHYSATLYTSGVSGIGGSGTENTLTQGTYTISGTGGTDIGAFTASVDLPGDFVWSNQDAIPDPIPRSSGLTITWTGGGTGLVTITGAALRQTGGTQQSPIYELTSFDCVAQASAGTFTVPASVLQQLPAVSNNLEQLFLGTLSVFAIPDVAKGQGVFSAPLTAGGTTDQAFFSYSISAMKNTGWR